MLINAVAIANWEEKHKWTKHTHTLFSFSSTKTVPNAKNTQPVKHSRPKHYRFGFFVATLARIPRSSLASEGILHSAAFAPVVPYR